MNYKKQKQGNDLNPVCERERVGNKEGEKSYIDLHIRNSINTIRIQTKHRSRKRLHQEHLLSHFRGFCFVTAPHQPHLKIGALDGRRRRNPQPQHISSWFSLIVVIKCSYYKTFSFRTIFQASTNNAQTISSKLYACSDSLCPTTPMLVKRPGALKHICFLEHRHKAHIFWKIKYNNKKNHNIK